ncbi:hypothetical protein R3Q06_36595, partial [Rhodococcus erythropolis]|uniref:hypothetical protein n=1 Tax=Rhodococcus erythropolis TaxID=1833 RepID=UPI0029492F4E
MDEIALPGVSRIITVTDWDRSQPATNIYDDIQKIAEQNAVDIYKHGYSSSETGRTYYAFSGNSDAILSGSEYRNFDPHSETRIASRYDLTTQDIRGDYSLVGADEDTARTV